MISECSYPDRVGDTFLQHPVHVALIQHLPQKFIPRTRERNKNRFDKLVRVESKMIGVQLDSTALSDLLIAAVNRPFAELGSRQNVDALTAIGQHFPEHQPPQRLKPKQTA